MIATLGGPRVSVKVSDHSSVLLVILREERGDGVGSGAQFEEAA
jgi:hypothetical protein